ncbi:MULTISPECIES: serine/threonine-protein kinase [unclassified Streptomyces]|uniref:serine/threonine-protein kinase n=1 Tax=unclassified Streptomyces TaxID=2593676 RepID=UPI000A7150EF|nr:MULTISPECIES: serine/threonine-protein kinase [unclassified Streptomyces]
MADVWKARDLLLNRTVVIKSLRVRTPTDELAQRFVREAKVLAAIDDPRIVKIYDVSAELSGQEYCLYLITQFLDGLTLQQYLAARPRPSMPEVLSLVRQLCEAVAMVHARDLVHRDLKPANLMLCPVSGASLPGGAQSRLVLIDFGIARPLSTRESCFLETGVTRHGYFVGTPAYTPPELFTGGAPSVASDLYSMGCILFEAIAGRGPFPDAADFTDYWNAHREAPVPSLRVERPDVPAPLDDLVRELLAKSPTDRPTGTAEVLARLDGIGSMGTAPGRRRRRAAVDQAGAVHRIEAEFQGAMSVTSPHERADLLEEVLRNAVDALSADHRVTWLIALNLGRTMQEAGRPEQAVSLLTILRTQLMTRLPAGDPIAILCRLNLARYTGECGRPAEAAAQLGELLAAVGGAIGADDRTLLEARFDQAHWSYTAGDVAAARRLFDALLTDHVTFFGPDGDDTRTLRGCLAGYPALRA